MVLCLGLWSSGTRTVLVLGIIGGTKVEIIIHGTVGHVVRGRQEDRKVTYGRNIFRMRRPNTAYAKPPELYEYLMAPTAQPGQIWCDPFAGSNPLKKAACRLGVNSVSIDVKFWEVGQ